jgi:acetylornithine deacetylase/succinyl-diaminopimelate desuccinylase-like protein
MGDLEKVFKHIDDHIPQHIAKMQEFIRQPSISQTMDGVQECAELLRDYFKELGCKDARLVKPQYYCPIVYGEYDAGAEKTVIIYFMYDVQPVDPIEEWSVPPFEARIVEMAPFKKVLMARGAINTKGPLMAFINAIESVKDATGELPVNLIFVAEGEEERLSVSLPKFVHDHQNKLKKADAVYFPGASQDLDGLANLRFGSEGIIYIELECSGAKWGRGPTKFGVHGINQRILDNPAWRMVHALSTLTNETGSRVEVEGWYDDVVVPSKTDLKLLEKGYRKSIPALKVFNPELQKKMLEAKVFIEDLTDPKDILKRSIFATTLCLDGIWGGWTGPGSKTYVPTKVTSKHNIRFVPNQNMDDLVRKIRVHLDAHGYKDIEIRKLGGYPWALIDYKTKLAEATYKMFERFGVPYVIMPPVASVEASPAWPAYVFSGEPLNLPIIWGSLGHGGRAHAPNEYYVMEGADAKYGRIHGLDGAEKSMATVLFNFAGKK